MPPIQFKLTKSDDFTRRATFQQLPNWNELAAKLQALYNISADRVGVSYIDNDNDEITVNSNEELQDFYQGSYKSGQVIKLHVLDLNKTRETPRIPTANRNTFGQDDFDFPADNDWQRLPPFSIAELFMGKESVSDGPHAFVEVLDSDISGFGKDVDNMSDTDSEGGRSTVQPSSVDKGKNKSSSFGAASVTSLVAEEASEKYPVHVLDHGSVKNGPPPSAAPPAASNPFSDPQPNITAQSTPKVQSQKVDTPQAQDTSVDVNMEDPPLPELDAPQQSNASASLSSDIATVLTTFTSVISSHPELSEGVRNIIRNATNGTYWQSHRSAMSQAAREMSRPAEEYNHDEAVRRISDALGGIFRSLSQTSANGESGNQQANQPANANPFDWHTPHFMRPPPPGGRAPWSRRFTTALDEGRPWHHWYAPPWTAGPHHPHGPPPPPPPPGFPGPPPPSDRTPPPPPPPPPAHGSPVPPPPPPPPAQPEPHFPGHLPGSPPLPPPPSPPPSHHRGPPPHQRGPPPEDDAPHRGPPPPGLPPGPPGPPPPPFGPHGPMPPPPHGSPFHHPHYHHHGPPPPPPPPPGRERDRVGPFYGRGMRAYGPAPFANPFATFTHTNGSRMSSEEMRAQLERAKAAYKAQKETYRQERELRKRERDRIMAAHRLASGESNNANPVTTQASSSLDNLQTTNIVSNAWGPYPQYEIQSIPRRSNTHPGHGLRRTERKSEDLYSRSLSRITKRLADMGFSETSHAELPEKIKSQLPTSGVISKEKEDDVVTTLLEDLLVSSPKPPVASGSGSRRQESREGAAGSWQ